MEWLFYNMKNSIKKTIIQCVVIIILGSTLIICASMELSKSATSLRSLLFKIQNAHYKDLFIILICLFGGITSSFKKATSYISYIFRILFISFGNSMIIIIVLVFYSCLNASALNILFDNTIMFCLSELLLSSYFWLCFYLIAYKKSNTTSIAQLCVIFTYYSSIEVLGNTMMVCDIRLSNSVLRIVLYLCINIIITIGYYYMKKYGKKAKCSQSNLTKRVSFKSILYLLIPALYTIICCRSIFEAVTVSEYLINVIEPLCFVFGSPEKIYTLTLLMILSYKSIVDDNTFCHEKIYSFFAYYLLSILLMISSVFVFFSKIGYINNEWSKFIYYYSFTTLNQTLSINMVFLPAYTVVFRPVSCFIIQLLLCGLYFSLCKITVDFLNSFLRNLTFPFLIHYAWLIMNDHSIYLQNWSPFSHAIIGNHSFGYDYKPKLLTSIITLMVINVFLMILSYIVKKIRFTSKRIKINKE